MSYALSFSSRRWFYAIAWSCLLGLFSANPLVGVAQEEEAPAVEELSPEQQDAMLTKALDLQWQEGPTRAKIGQQAEIQLAASYRMLDKNGTQNLLRAFGNLPDAGDIGLLSPAGSVDWFVVFSFEEIGYVKDDEKEDIDKEALFEHFRAGTEQGNERRRAQGTSEMELVGWEVEPYYNTENNSLEWGLRFRSEGHDIVNYFSKRLGRNGVMNCNLVVEPDQLKEVLSEMRQVMTGFEFQSGNKYAEFQKGDKIAEYGLTALVAGGALAIAAKSGLLGKLWKVILVAFLALAGFVKKLFGGGKSSEASESSVSQ